MKLQKNLVKWRSWLLWVALFLTFLKVWIPGSLLAPVEVWVHKADTLIGHVHNLLSGRPPVRSNKKWIVANKGVYQGTVQAVHDGDTVHVLDTNGHMHKIRLANIDAPELKQAYGMASRDALQQRVESQQVDVNVVAVDQYKREVGQIILNNIDVNLWMVTQGYAWHYNSIARKQQNRSDFNRYQQAQIQAQQNRRGLWHNSRAIAPWYFRQQQKAH